MRLPPGAPTDGAWAGQLPWGELTHPRVLGVLSNPCYAVAYVFCRHRSRWVVRPDGTITTKVVELPPSERPVVIQDHHPGYHAIAGLVS